MRHFVEVQVSPGPRSWFFALAFGTGLSGLLTYDVLCGHGFMLPYGMCLHPVLPYGHC